MKTFVEFLHRDWSGVAGKTNLALVILAAVALLAVAIRQRVVAEDPVTAAAAVGSAENDTDGDGFADYLETGWHTDPHNADSAPDLQTGTVAWWPLDEGRGLTGEDISGNGYTATAQELVQPHWISDETGTALLFDGSATALLVPNDQRVAAARSFTALAWVKVDRNRGGAVLGKWSADRRTARYQLQVADGRAAVQVRVDGQDWPLFGQRPVADDTWHHLAAVYDGDQLRLYVDGEHDVTVHLHGVLPVAEGPLLIGGLSGALRDVGLYERAFTGAEVKLLYLVASRLPQGMSQRQPRVPVELYARYHERSRELSDPLVVRDEGGAR